MDLQHRGLLGECLLRLNGRPPGHSHAKGGGDHGCVYFFEFFLFFFFLFFFNIFIFQLQTGSLHVGVASSFFRQKLDQIIIIIIIILVVADVAVDDGVVVVVVVDDAAVAAADNWLV